MYLIQFDSEALLKRLLGCSTAQEALSFLEKCVETVRGFEQVGSSTFAAMGWEYRIGDLDNIQREHDNLKIAVGFGVKCAPRVYSCLSLGGNIAPGDAGSALIVTCLDGCAYRKPIVIGGRSVIDDRQELLSARTINQLIKDVGLLVSKGYYHKDGLSSFGNWLFNPYDQCIVFRGWDSMRPIVAREEERWQSQLLGLLDLLAN